MLTLFKEGIDIGWESGLPLLVVYLCEWSTFVSGLPLWMVYLCEWSTFVNGLH